MLRTIFIGSKNEFDEMLVHWLAQRTELVGVVWINATTWQRSWKGRLDFALRRYRRYGLWKVIDETLFYLFFRAFMHDRDDAELQQRVIKPYAATFGNCKWNGDSVFTRNVNSIEVISFLEERQPDMVLAMCINNYFGRKLRAIPRLGVFLWHEGITPEYRGLYSPFWAVHNLDFEHIGYTLLRMNDQYDAGEVFVQGQALNIDPVRHYCFYTGHKAIADSLPHVAKFLDDLEAGLVEPMNRSDCQSSSYTYPGLSDLIRQRFRLWRLHTKNGDHLGSSRAAVQPFSENDK